MKRFYIFLVISALITFNSFSQTSIETPDTYTYDNLISKIESVGKPYIEEDFIVFTAKDSPRHIGIAFDFENYKEIHSFQRLSKTDMNNEISDTLYFYILEVPKGIKKVLYRLVIDGLWTVDPENPLTEFDKNARITLSRVDINRIETPKTFITENNTVKFIYIGETGKKIRLGGSFTNWDSSIYFLKETSKGFYELELPLPKGTHYYTFYEGISSFIDSTNPVRAYSKDGKITSAITIE